jgi:hypothetical protein
MAAVPEAEEGVALTTSVPRDRLAPALLGAVLFAAALALAHGPMCGDGQPQTRGPA